HTVGVKLHDAIKGHVTVETVPAA
ncbi:50S ribosomal protein L9, partial [Pseudonocardia sp. EV170527-09]